MTNQNEVLRLAEAADLFRSRDQDNQYDIWILDLRELTKLITLAKQSAYEDAAKLCESLAEKYAAQEYYRHPELQTSAEIGILDAADAIRNRADEVTK